MEDWKRIKTMRTDMSDYVMHCTRPRSIEGEYVGEVDVFKTILFDGYLRATFVSEGRARPGVRGPDPAVCFTEQPLRFFMQTVDACSTVRYTKFAVAFRKDDLYSYGGRPVIYADEGSLGNVISMGPSGASPWMHSGGIPLDLQYLWVRYDPTAIWNRPYPIDWTHEREWRARPNISRNQQAGLGSESDVGVPLHIPTDRSCSDDTARFVVLVDTDAHAIELKSWIAEAAPEIASKGGYWANYAPVLEQAQVISFEVIKACFVSAAGALGRLDEYIPVLEE